MRLTPHTIQRKLWSSPSNILLLSLAVLAFSSLITCSSRIRLFSLYLRTPSIRALTTSNPVRSASMTFDKELQIAELAVQRATLLTKRVFNEKAKGTTSKDDKSPVTIGDFGAQALIISAIRKNFPQDEIVGEEDADDLRKNETLRMQIWELVRKTKLEDDASEALLGGSIASVEEMLDTIDYGRSVGGSKGRIWALDPIDGTKGFLRGGQYAVCLALMVDGQVKVGVLGCPNLPVDDTAPLDAHVGQNQSDEEGKGVLFSAIAGQGASSRPLSKGALLPSKPISMKPISDITQATFCESVEAGHSSHGDQAAIAQQLGITKASVRMDSQAKYGSIARGAGDLYLRLPVRKDYEEKIWDHAAGELIVREAGGVVTDVQGQRLDFGVGRTLKNNKGVVAAPKAVHDRVLEVVKSVLGSK